MAGGESLHFRHEILLAVIDRQIGAKRPAGLGFGTAPDRDHHDGAKRLAELDGGGADSRTAAGYQRPKDRGHALANR